MSVTTPVVQPPPPPYGFTNPSSGFNNSNDPYAKTVPPTSQSQWGRPNPSVAPVMMNVNINQIENYMVWSVLNILFCCLCLGFLACYYSSETNNAKLRNDFQGALSASKNARTINIIATVLGTIITINYILYVSGTY